MREGNVDEAPAERDTKHSLQRLSLGFGLLVAVSGALIVLGSMVRAHGAGLACPDWPLCFGEWVPRMDIRIAFEWSHRLLAGSLSLLFAGLALATWRQASLQRSTRRMLVLAAVLLGVQILLGAFTVWKLLAAWTVTAHLVTGNAFALVLLLTALSLRESARPSEPRQPLPRAARSLLLSGAVLLGVQLVLGGLVSSRYAGLACPEWPRCNGGLWFPAWGGSVGLHILHRLNGYALTLLFVAAALAFRRALRLRALTIAISALLFLQLAVGVANVLWGLPAEITALHSALACALVLAAGTAVREVVLAPRFPGAGATRPGAC